MASRSVISTAVVCFLTLTSLCRSADPLLKLHWEKDYLTITGDHVSGKQISIHYLEAYCRAGSTDADWVKHTVVGHTTRQVEANADGTMIRLEDIVQDGIRVTHEITTTHDEVRFEILAKNPTDKRSEAVSYTHLRAHET